MSGVEQKIESGGHLSDGTQFLGNKTRTVINEIPTLTPDLGGFWQKNESVRLYSGGLSEWSG